MQQNRDVNIEAPELYNEEQRHERMLAYLILERRKMEITKLHGIDPEESSCTEAELNFGIKAVDIALSQMVGRARLLGQSVEDRTHYLLGVLTETLQEKRDQYGR